MSDCNLLWCGKYTQHADNNMHSHDYFQMLSVIAGTGVLQIEKDSVELEKGLIYLIQPGQQHSIIMHDNNKSSAGLKLFDVKFTVDNSALLNDICKLKVHLEVESINRVNKCFGEIIEESTNKLDHYYSVICSLLQEILVYLVRVSSKNNIKQPPTHSLILQGNDSIDENTIVKNLVDYINYNYMHNISIEELSRYIGINRTTLINTFKQHFGITPIRYVNKVRLEKSKELLENSNVSISDISALVGFQSIHYFSNYFKAHEHITPAKYRAQQTNSKYFSFDSI